MDRRIFKAGILASSVAIVILGWVLLPSHEDVEAQTNNTEHPFKTLNSLAVSATSSNSTSIDSLFNQAILCATRLKPEDTANFSGVVTRIKQAEIKYRNNQRDGIPEVKVVEALNGLATRFDAPEYARTNEPEVRELRTSLAAITPSFVGVFRPSEANMISTQQLNPLMSPIEAAYVSLLMVHQKRQSPYYQMTHAERLAKWPMLQSPGARESLPYNEDRQAEMNAVASNATSGMTLAQANSILNRALDIMGIE